MRAPHFCALACPFLGVVWRACYHTAPEIKCAVRIFLKLFSFGSFSIWDIVYYRYKMRAPHFCALAIFEGEDVMLTSENIYPKGDK